MGVCFAFLEALVDLDLRGSERIFVIVISTDLYFVRGKRAMISFFFFGCFLGVGRCLRVGRVGWWRLAKWGKIGRFGSLRRRSEFLYFGS